MKDINCPYCNKPQDINHDDGYGYEEDVKHQQHCIECGKEFVFETCISYNYESYPAECLNNGRHRLKPSKTIHEYFTTMDCQDCSFERKPTKEERIEYNLPLEYKPIGR